MREREKEREKCLCTYLRTYVVDRWVYLRMYCMTLYVCVVCMCVWCVCVHVHVRVHACISVFCVHVGTESDCMHSRPVAPLTCL